MTQDEAIAQSTEEKLRKLFKQRNIAVPDESIRLVVNIVGAEWNRELPDPLPNDKMAKVIYATGVVAGCAAMLLNIYTPKESV